MSILLAVHLTAPRGVSKNRGILPPKMDGENHGSNPIKHGMFLGEKTHYSWKYPNGGFRVVSGGFLFDGPKAPRVGFQCRDSTGFNHQFHEA